VTSTSFPADGGCDCKAIRYRMMTAPMFVHCCHCRWCQRETGSAFVLNALIETDRVELVAGAPAAIATPSHSGRGQTIYRCPTCQVAVFSTYSMPTIRFVRVGTLDHPDRCPPDIHIFTSSKQPWFELPRGALAFPEYYDSAQHWPAASLERRTAAFAASRGK